MSITPLAATYAALAAHFAAAFRPTIQGARTVGREAEYPVVTARGEAANVRRLWEPLLAYGDLTPKYEPGRFGERDFIVGLVGDDFSYMLEVGLGTIEVNTRPCADLFQINEIQEEAVGRLVRAAARFGWRVLGYGIQPVSPPSVQIMAPKQRYLSLYRAMGNSWLWYTVTASDQVQVVVGRDEMVAVLNTMNLLTPVIIALCANSPVFGGRLSRFCSAREGEMADIYATEHRHGMLTHPMRDMADYVESMAQTTYLIMHADGEVIPSSRPFVDYLQEHGADFDAFLFHEHYMWNSARLRAAYGTIEVRPACQQPWGEQMAACALGLGLVQAHGQIAAYAQESMGPGYWADMQRYQQQVIRHGLRAPQPAPDLLRTVLGMAEDGLRERGLGEERFLTPLWKRLARQVNPAQHMRAVFQSDGLSGLLAKNAIRPMVRRTA